MTFDETNEIVDSRDTKGGRAASLRGDGEEHEENSGAKEASTAVILGRETSVRFDEGEDILDGEVKAIETGGGFAASQRVDGGEHEENSGAKEASAVILGRETPVRFDDGNDILDGDVKAIETGGGNAASQRVDGGEHEENSEVKEASAVILGRETSVRFDDGNDILDGEVKAIASKELLTAEINGKQVSVIVFHTTNVIVDEEVGVGDSRGRRERLTAEINERKVEVSVLFDETTPEVTDSNKVNIFNPEERLNLQKRRKPRTKKRFGRVVRKNKALRSSSASVPSLIKVYEGDKDSLSSISTTTDTDRKSNLQRSLGRSKRLVKAMNIENKKNQTKINKLTKQINEMNQEFIKEKKPRMKY